MSISADMISSIAELSSAIIAGVALIIAINEYRKHKEHKECDVLTRYHERYNNDAHIEKVLHYYLGSKNNEDKDKFVTPDEHDKEMFLRFFEEIELMIQKKYLHEEDVKKLFIFYFMVFWKFEDFLADSDKDYWPLAEELYNRFKYDKNLMNLVKQTQEEFNHNS